MSYEKVKQAKTLLIGTKQTTKAIEQGNVTHVFIARDADQQIVNPILDICKDRGIQVSFFDTMKLLGKACGIQVGAAMAALPKKEQ